MQYPNRIMDLVNQRNPLIDLFGGQRNRFQPPMEGDVGPRPDIGPRYLKDDRPGMKSLADLFGRDPRESQRLMTTGRPPDRQGLATGRKDDRPGSQAAYHFRDPRTGEVIHHGGLQGYGTEQPPPGDGPLTYAEWVKENPGGTLEEYKNYLMDFGGRDDDGDDDGDDGGDGRPTISYNEWLKTHPGGTMEEWRNWCMDNGYIAGTGDGGGLPDWMTGRFPGEVRPFGRGESRGEDTRMLPRGFGMDWFDDLLRHFDWGGNWTDPKERQKRGGKMSTVMSANMLNIMNRIANQGVLGPEGRKFITSGDKRESQLRRKGLRKELERSIGKQLGPRGGGAIMNMLFNQLDAPDFARREGKAADLREFDMKSRMAGVEGLAQMLNFFEAMFKGEQVKSTGGPGALSTIGDVGKIAASVAALL